MFKSEKANKQFVRHPCVPISKKTIKPNKVKKVHFLEVDSEPNPETDNTEVSDGPEFLTILQLANEVNKLRRAKCSVQTSAEETNYNLNFMPEQKLFQNLIDLDVQEKNLPNKTRSQSSIRSNSKKDAEPNYQDLLTYKLQPGYLFSSYNSPEGRKPLAIFDGHSLFKKVKMWTNI